MSRAAANLPDDVEALRAIIADQAERLQSRDTLLEDIEAAAAETVLPIPPAREDARKSKPARRPLPDHLPAMR